MSIRILYVDDEPDIREVACLSLGLDPQIEVRSCDSGEQALRDAADWQPDLILLDVMMPGMGGPETLAALRRQPETQATRIVFITARTQAADVERLSALGAAGIIAKPFDPMSLAAEARAFLP